MNKSKPKALVIVGPTASGKSDLAVRLAKRLNGEVISADSRQVYKGLNIGTGKITKAEMKGVKHHLLDVVEPSKQFTVTQYQDLATKALEDIVSRGKLPIICGGTGFYIDTVTHRAHFPDVSPNKLLRKKLNKLKAEELFKILTKKDPARAKSIDPHNKLRLIRALEIVESLGKVPQPTANYLLPTAEFIYLGLKPKDLDKRIKKRLLKRIPGIVREAKKLSPKRAHELGLEYRFAMMYIKGKLTRAKFVEGLNTAINQYAKRQTTWFKRNKEITWHESAQSAYESALKQVGGAKRPRSRK